MELAGFNGVFPHAVVKTIMLQSRLSETTTLARTCTEYRLLALSDESLWKEGREAFKIAIPAPLAFPTTEYAYTRSLLHGGPCDECGVWCYRPPWSMSLNLRSCSLHCHLLMVHKCVLSSSVPIIDLLFPQPHDICVCVVRKLAYRGQLAIRAMRGSALVPRFCMGRCACSVRRESYLQRPDAPPPST
ncbi:hypothetical protein C8J57DRAFT_196420 [Mycena rebaudengoi]|nr:hypothetical protein C8J57DRAFT_196420 [Mycena rebaudengoi]